MIKIVLAKNFQAISIKFSRISLEIQKQNSQFILEKYWRGIAKDISWIISKWTSIGLVGEVRQKIQGKKIMKFM